MNQRRRIIRDIREDPCWKYQRRWAHWALRHNAAWRARKRFARERRKKL